MSNNGTLVGMGQEIVALYGPSLIQNYCILSATVIVLYDHIVTIPLELSQIWSGRFNIMKALFILSRYCGLIYIYSYVLFYFVEHVSDKRLLDSCQIFLYITDISVLLYNFAFNGIFTLRTFVIYGKSWTLFFVLAIPGAVNLAATIWVMIVQSASAYPPQFQIGPFTCSASTSPSVYASDTASLVSIISTAVFDALVIILTIYRTGRLAIRSRKANITGSLSIILLRDGIIYYATIFLPTFAILALNLILSDSGDQEVLLIFGYVNYIANALQIVMVNRLVLDLSHSATTPTNSEDSALHTWTDPHEPVFNTDTILGYIGAPVRTFGDDYYEVKNEDVVAPVMKDDVDQRNVVMHSISFAKDSRVGVIKSETRQCDEGDLDGRDIEERCVQRN